MRKLLTVIIAVTSLGASYAFGDTGFQGLGASSPNISISMARGISPDGSVVVGSVYSFSWTGTYKAFRWSETTGMAWLPNLFGGYLFPPKNFAYAASAYGAVIVGVCISGWPYNASEACRWTAPSYSVEGLSSLGLGGAAAVSADGSVIVGTNSAGVAARWTEATGMVALTGASGSGGATDVSADGSVVVGTWNDEAFYWTAATGMVGLGYLPGTSKSQASSVSADGLVVVGLCNPFSNAEAFRWTAATGMVGLGHLPGTNYSQANGVSGDGSVIVGICDEAFIWDAINGMRSLQDLLVNDFGLDLTGWALSHANDISADGQRIVGIGTNPNGSTEAWLATIPAPTMTVAGSVTADCPAPNTGLADIVIDLYEQGTGDLVSSALTDANGNYLIEDITPGDYIVTCIIPLSFDVIEDEVPITLAGGATEIVDFPLTCTVIDPLPPGLIHTLSSAYWKGQVGKLLKGQVRDIDAATLCGYLDLIEGNFNSNVINQVLVYEPPTSGVCMDKLLVAGDLLNARGDSAEVAKARKQLMALLLNVASGKLSQTAIISVDGATVSQAITYCDNIIDDPNGDYHLARDICKEINKNHEVAAGVIDLSTENIVYKQRESESLPTEFSLGQNFPNPFNPSTDISFSLPSASHVKLEIFNVMGQKVATLVDGQLEAGEHIVQWDGSSVASGVYLYRLMAADFVDTKKMILLK